MVTEGKAYSMIWIRQAGNFHKSFQFQYDTFGYLRCERPFLGFGRDCSSCWHFFSSSSLLLFSSPSISTISSLLNSSWSTLLQVLKKDRKVFWYVVKQKLFPQHRFVTAMDFKDLQSHCFGRMPLLNPPESPFLRGHSEETSQSLDF